MAVGPETYLFGLAVAARYDVTEIARPTVQRLARLTGESAFFSVRRGDETVCLIREDGSFPIRSHVLYEGIRFPLGVASAGLAVLAFLPRTGPGEFSPAPIWPRNRPSPLRRRPAGAGAQHPHHWLRRQSRADRAGQLGSRGRRLRRGRPPAVGAEPDRNLVTVCSPRRHRSSANSCSARRTISPVSWPSVRAVDKPVVNSRTARRPAGTRCRQAAGCRRSGRHSHAHRRRNSGSAASCGRSLPL